MITAKELRIGNWYHEFGVPKQVTAETIFKLDSIESRGKTAVDISKIPLTREILVEAGFKSYNISGSSFIHWSITDEEQMRDTLWSNGDAIYSSHSGVRLDYIHQLQNLIFALTRKELNIQL